MCSADLILGAVSIPIYLTNVGYHFQLWASHPFGIHTFSVFYSTFDNTFLQVSLISAVFISCERLYAIRWPFQHRTLSMRAYRTFISVVWVIAQVVSLLLLVLNLFVSFKTTVLVWTPYIFTLIFITCSCNISIWMKFRHGEVVSPLQETHQLKRDLRNKQLTKTLLLVSFVSLLSFTPLFIMNFLIGVFHVSIPWTIYFLATVVNYCNSFANPVVYALRIPEFREVLALCCPRSRRQVTRKVKFGIRREKINIAAGSLTTGKELMTLQIDHYMTNN